MAPLIVLLITFAAVYLIDRFALGSRLGLSFAGRAAMAAMLIVTGIAHFTETEKMMAMMPGFVPAKREMVYFTGVIEFLAVPGLLWQRTAKPVSFLLILFFVAILPANIIGSIKEVELGGMEHGPIYLLFRIPLQLFFIWWVYYFGIRKAP
jgi:uncharacterized membrane protein